ncbi:uncharacterized protein CC84DRAFT_1162372 [Paraphaeosphaeria sporulosa]|uniref:Uncharacterized protein n=1 Tax=Paraphaeosphaeria sporulosa TaxID=1460663 RepID=A0A177CNS7_9PLEO|nr:uncharacterized protein CC84DRAFT_1162372 [Paraphaeosphaeria sporulosa]OAG08417.1 hypothetical protein CC84DRAFT_1162372 [Paraphaeosphaeria sporulosa]
MPCFSPGARRHTSACLASAFWTVLTWLKMAVIVCFCIQPYPRHPSPLATPRRIRFSEHVSWGLNA